MSSDVSDRQVWDYAGQNGLAIITADHDFLLLANTLGAASEGNLIARDCQC